MEGHVAYLLEIETSNVLVLFHDLPEDGVIESRLRPHGVFPPRENFMLHLPLNHQTSELNVY